MPQIAQRLREPAAFVLLAYAAISTLFYTIDFLFAPGNPCASQFCAGPDFSDRAPAAISQLLSPVLVIVLLAAVVLAHVGTHLKSAKVISLVALIVAGVAALFGLIAVFSSFGSHSGGWSKTEDFFLGLAQLAVLGVAGWLILGYFQQHAPARPAAGFGQPPQGFQQQWQQPGQWQGQPQQGPGPQGQPQQWGQPQGQGQPQPPANPVQQPAAQPWGPPPPAPPQQQQGQQQGQGFGGDGPGSDSMMTQAIPAMPQTPQAPPAPPAGQAPPETQQFPPVGNWTTEG
jgi:hypothetical protein